MYIGEAFIFGLLGNPTLLNVDELEKFIAVEGGVPLKINKRNKLSIQEGKVFI